MNSENLDGLLSSVRRVFDKELDTARKVHTTTPLPLLNLTLMCATLV